MSWQRLCARSDLQEGQARGFDFGARSVFLVVQDGVVRGYWNWCPHLGIDLNFMPDQFLDDQEQYIMCANHGALFEIASGECVSGPCHGETLQAVPLEERDGSIWVNLDGPPI